MYVKVHESFEKKSEMEEKNETKGQDKRRNSDTETARGQDFAVSPIRLSDYRRLAVGAGSSFI